MNIGGYNLKLDKNLGFVIAIVFQLIILVVIIINNLLIVASGKTVNLRIEGYDPTDYLRGDYIIYTLKDISQVNYTLDVGEKDLQTGEGVYIILENRGIYWAAKDISREKPSGDKIFIKGRVSYTTSNYLGKSTSNSKKVNLLYGIEKFYIPENSGNNINLNRQNTINNYIKVVIDKNGNSRVTDLFVDGKSISDKTSLKQKTTPIKSTPLEDMPVR